MTDKPKTRSSAEVRAIVEQCAPSLAPQDSASTEQVVTEEMLRVGAQVYSEWTHRLATSSSSRQIVAAIFEAMLAARPVQPPVNLGSAAAGGGGGDERVGLRKAGSYDVPLKRK